MTTPAAAAIEVRDLCVRYGELIAVDDLSFSVAAGTVVALLGPNGAGKTSTVEALAGFRIPATGRLQVLGLDPRTDHAALTRRVGVMLQQGGVYTGARPPEVLRLFASYHAHPADPEELLDRVGLSDQAGTTWRHLSGGEQQRLSLALALVGNPELVFLDEPTAGIDPAGRQVIRQIITSLRAAGVTVVVTTHDLADAESLADQVVIIDRGRVVADGPPAELMTATADDHIRFGAAPGIDTTGLGAALGCGVEEFAPGEYRAATAPSPAAVAALTGWLAEQNLPLADLRAGRQSLEDVFLRLTAESTETTHADAGADADPAGNAGGRRRRRSRTGRR